MISWADVSKALRTGEALLGVAQPIAANANAVAGVVVGTVEAAVGLAADIIDAGQHPITTITRMRSSIADFADATTSLERYATTGRL